MLHWEHEAIAFEAVTHNMEWKHITKTKLSQEHLAVNLFQIHQSTGNGNWSPT